MKQVITHPSHPAHTLSLLVAPVYDGGYFNCDGCGIIGTGFSYQCSRCDFDIHALCAYKPLSITHKSHPQHNLQVAFHSPYGANKGFSCDICLKIGKNQWLYRCIPCEFDAHVGCISAPQPHLLQHSTSAPTPHTHHAGHPQHQNSLPMANQASNRPRPMTRPGPRPMTRPGPSGNPNRPMAQNVAAYEPRRQNNNSGYNGQVGPIGTNEIIGEERQSFGQGSMDGSGYDGSAGTEEFDGGIDVEVEYVVNVYEGAEDGEANDEGEDVDDNGLEIVAYGDDYDGACSESEFGGSSDARSQCNDSADADLYPLPPPPARINQGSGGGGRKKNANPNGPTARSKNNGPRNPTQSPLGPQTRKVPNVRNNAIRANGAVRFNRPRDPTAVNGPQGFNGPIGGPSNAIDNGGINDNYNNNQADMYGGNNDNYNNSQADMYGGNNDNYNNNEADIYGGEDNVDGYEESYGDEYAGDCDFEAGGDFVNNEYDQAYDETYDENDFESYNGGSESLYDGEEYEGSMDGSQYSGLNDEPIDQYLPVAGPGGGPGINNQYGQTGRPRNMGRYGRGGTTNMNRYGNMNQGGTRAQPRSFGQAGQYRPNGRPNMVNGGPNGPNGPNGNILMNTMVQGLAKGFALNMLLGGDVSGGAGDGGLFGGDSGLGDSGFCDAGF
ncbi:hypothetical protein AALP_AA6G234500 [Arabis alpina]|uniref:DC1 domain-containing protein n=1 Tax=Arabis alpina TaxID=50452 RepID=A0A087GR83_ARAAL|nr:hypothetical protein AALP_AA6G234500 [Arabis alpina]